MTTVVAATRAGVTFDPPGSDGLGRLVVDRADDAVNALNTELIEDLAAAVRAARACQGLRGLIVTSAKLNHWVAGADLKLVTQAKDAGQLEQASRRLQAVYDELAWLPCTTVAAINGAALGGGLELALACDYRVGSDAPSVSLGQPEVNLGLVPGGGGTQRLPRLIGLQRGMELILSGRRLTARRARRAGLLDEVVHPSVLDQAARAWAHKGKRPLDRPLAFGLSVAAAMDVAEQTPAGRRLLYRVARQAVLRRTGGRYPAPLKALEAIQAGFEHGLARGFEVEARAFGELAMSQTAKHLLWLFLATQRQRRPRVAGPAAQAGASRQQQAHDLGTPGSPPPAAAWRRLELVGVVGAGFMGAAIAEVAAVAGLEVRVRDMTTAAVARGLGAIRALIDQAVERRRFDPLEGRTILQRVSGSTDYSGFPRADLVIEAVFEDLAAKRWVVRDVEAVLPPDVVIASNTSALPISDIAREAAHPERIIGMHFFSPAERMPLVEIIQPAAAAEWAVERAVELATRLGKTVIVVSDGPGFFTTRVLGVMLNEAAVLLAGGESIEHIDAAMTAFGFPAGPFVLYDEVGLRVALHAAETLARAFGDRIPPATIVPRLVEAGQTGRQAGAGFYVWSRSPRYVPRSLRGLVWRPKRVPNPVVAELVGHGVAPRLSVQEIQDRLALLLVNEAIRCLEEAVLRSPTDGDLGAVLGLGFPPLLGGPFHYADSLGLATLRDKLQTLARTHGRRYEPAALLVDRAREGRTFFEE